MKKIKNNIWKDLLPAIFLVVLIWAVFVTNYVIPYELNSWGVHPQKSVGLWGILFAPILHGGWAHILSNSAPIFILTYLLYRYYREIAFSTLLVAWVMVGLLVWITGVGGVHIGMSGVIYALASFLFVSGLVRKYKPLIGISFFVAFMYGGLIWGVLPLQEGVSWESHLWGGVVGIVLAIYYRKKGPTEPKYQYEIEEEMGVEPETPIEVRSIAEEKMRYEQEQKANRQSLKVHYRIIPKQKKDVDD